MNYNNYLNIEESELDKDIYRIMPIHRLLEIFNIKKLTLVSPNFWDDPFENFLLKSAVDFGSDGVADLSSIRESICGQCWSLHKETDAMWRIYSSDKQGVKIKTTIRKLFLSLLNSNFNNSTCFIGKVEYLNQINLVSKLKNIDLFNSDGSGVAESLLYKRLEFSHEKEIRLIFTECRESIYQFDIDPYDLFDEIVFDPRVDDYLYDVYSLGIKSKGYKKSIRKSVMYKVPTALTLLMD